MRTNPFFDSWLFLIGATDDHRALGIFQYVMRVGLNQTRNGFLFWLARSMKSFVALRNSSSIVSMLRSLLAIPMTPPIAPANLAPCRTSISTTQPSAGKPVPLAK